MSNLRSKKLRMGLLIAGVVLLGMNFLFLDYDQLASKPLSKENVGAVVRILSNVCIIAAMVISLKFTAKERGK